MSEQFPLFDEQAEHSPHDEYIDVRETIQWEDFLGEMHAAEEAMSLYQDPTDPDTCELSAKRSIELTEVFGYEYNGQPSHVLGLAYSNAAPDRTVIFNVNYATFHGCDLKFINEQWQAAFEFYTDGTDNDTPKGSYYVPVDQHHILDLKIRADFGDDDDMTAVQMLHDQAETAQAYVTSSDFLALPADAQRRALENICASADSELPHDLRSESKAIDCERYYTRYDDMPGFDIRDFMTDGSAPSENNEFILPQGFITGYDYPELDTLPAKQVLNAWNFDIAAGAPCLVVRNDMEARTHYIPSADIKDIF
ncbi:MAG TPA: hypothetical protein VF281_04860 [Candidatus Saccharimonadales bacterium]